MSYIGSTPTTQSFIAGTDYFNGDGSTVAFTLSRSVVSVNDIEVVINNVEQQPNTAYTVSGTTITFTSAPSAGTANIYVRYLSTTTQSITPSQNTVGWNQLTTDVQQDLGISFKNRIINGAMVINQRGFSGSVDTTNPYTLDRFQGICSASSKYTVSQNAGSVTPPAGFVNYLGATSSAATTVNSSDYYFILQPIEGYNMADLGWGTVNAKTVTLSFRVYSSLTGTFGGSLRNSDDTRSYPFSYTISAANTWTTVSVTITGETTGTWLKTNGTGIKLNFSLGCGSSFLGTAGAWASSQLLSVTGETKVVNTSGATFYITGVQLEVGTQATTFDYRSIGTELALCQRYYTRATAFTNYAPVGVGRAWGSGNGNAPFYLPVLMRSNPTITYSSLTHFDVVTLGNPTAIQNDGAHQLCVKVGWAKAATSGNLYQFEYGNSGTSAWLGFDSEL